MSDQVEKRKDLFSHKEAHILNGKFPDFIVNKAHQYKRIQFHKNKKFPHMIIMIIIVIDVISSPEPKAHR